MFRFVAYLLLPLCLLGQPMPHWHAHGQPAGHDARPHFHLPGGNAGHDDHMDGHGRAGNGETACSSVPDHDHDAVFLSGVTSDGTVAKPLMPPGLFLADTLWIRPELVRNERAGLPHPPLHPPDAYGGIPAIVQTMALRI